MSDLVGNPEDTFSHNEAHIIFFPLPRNIGGYLMIIEKYFFCQIFIKTYVVGHLMTTWLEPFVTTKVLLINQHVHAEEEIRCVFDDI